MPVSLLWLWVILNYVALKVPLLTLMAVESATLSLIVVKTRTNQVIGLTLYQWKDDWIKLGTPLAVPFQYGNNSNPVFRKGHFKAKC